MRVAQFVGLRASCRRIYARALSHGQGVVALKALFFSGYLFWSLGFASLAQAGEVFLQSFQSATLGRDYAYTVYLPDAYRSSALKFPVLYLLHGAGGNENEWLHLGGVRDLGRADRPQADPADGRGDARPRPGLVDGRCARKGRDCLAEGSAATRRGPLPRRRHARQSPGGGPVGRWLWRAQPGAQAPAAVCRRCDPEPGHLRPRCHRPIPAATRDHPFQKDGRFDPALWQSQLYTRYIDRYKAGQLIVPLYISAGDHDTFGIALQSAMLLKSGFACTSPARSSCAYWMATTNGRCGATAWARPCSS